MTRGARFADPRWVVAVAAFVFTTLVFAKLAVHRFDASYFVMSGSACNPAETPRALTCPTDDNRGYDGLFFYRLALDPFTTKQVDFGIAFDRPSYRQQRILLPITAWALAGGGRPAVVHFTLIGLNLLAAIALAALATKLAQSVGAHPAWALPLCLYPGLLISLARDLSEVSSCALLLAGLVLARRQRWWWASIAFFLAMLARETTSLVPLALLLVQVTAWLRQRGGARPRASHLVACAWPFAGFLAWQLLLMKVWGIAPVLSNRGQLLAPFVGLARFAVDAVRHAYVLDLLQIGLLLLTSAATALALARAKVPSWEKIAWVLYALLATLLSDKNHWVDPASYFRVNSELFLIGGVILLATIQTRTRILLSAWGALSALSFVLEAQFVKL